MKHRGAQAHPREKADRAGVGGGMLGIGDLGAGRAKSHSLKLGRSTVTRRGLLSPGGS